MIPIDGVRAPPVRLGGWIEAIYAHALVAAERLVERHGVPAVLGSFEAFARPAGSARSLPVRLRRGSPSFDEAFRAHLARVLG